MKKARIEIRDSKRTIDGKAAQAYRVVCVGANGEILQNSEVLNDKNAVYTHIKAMAKLWTFGLEATKPPSGYPALVDDKTKAQTFAKKGLKVA